MKRSNVNIAALCLFALLFMQQAAFQQAKESTQKQPEKNQTSAGSVTNSESKKRSPSFTSSNDKNNGNDNKDDDEFKDKQVVQNARKFGSIVNEEDKDSDDGYEANEVVNKNPRQILKLRGFKSENHYFKTIDGYFVSLVRIVNPFISRFHLKRPVLFNHGLFESATIWLINSRDVKAKRYKQKCDSHGHYINETIRNPDDNELRNVPMYLANRGYDVWLMSMRGTLFSRYHTKLNYTEPEFWDYSLDDFAMKDVPGAINYIRARTKSRKVAYLGHSQATFSVFALLTTQQNYSKIIEPVGAVAPVAFFDHITSIIRPAILAALHQPDQNFNGPFPPNADKVREGLGELCHGTQKRHDVELICNFIAELVSGPSGKGWYSGYYSHVPFSTSHKVIRHFGQIIKDKRFKKYDYGPVKNTLIYGKSKAPDYEIENIISNNICLYWSSKDTIAAPRDVERFIERLKVPLLSNVFIEDDSINHLDLITHENGSRRITKDYFEILERLTKKYGESICKAK